MIRVLVIHGPNLDRLGEREPHIYGRQSLADIDARLAEEADRLGVQLESMQSNHEGAIVDALSRAVGRFDAVVINPAAYSHYSLAIRDALAALPLVRVEVHLSNVFAREGFRQRMVTAGACSGVILGFGGESYVLALRAAVEMVRRQERNGGST
ncbi:type II 3-dehydroquinate dehydratase [Geochorda subterranea]|uniref:3-dehydroquinate dehydratase n=1 Tax=Geochorda subterranea TaxID=3109564 RepID=A0ABZ1BKX5_9FIRM|nr:type II 3-dehydroquinate dehydratase [Limnochorda sp. LNt]WRP13472.1 type II 3-dehydroquinate dehydratase [Limnochorda sp. LNt]